ncbi:hypothetical protein [Halobacteriovorax sp. RT-1-4]|uniref:hypothetical protein n=1 Tax=unclassified Halobacteriovorax TaxID=2639665 RepID=UPI003999C89C
MKFNSLLTITSLCALLISCNGGSINGRSLSSVSNNVEVFSVGDIKTSIFSPEEFRSIHGPAWVLMDGGKDFQRLRESFPELSLNQLLGHGIPDARGKFLRMHNNGAKCTEENEACSFDAQEGRVLGSYQEDAFQNITGTLIQIAHGRDVGSSGSGVFQHIGQGNRGNAQGGGRAQSYKFDASLVARTSTETRPKNIAVNFYVKVIGCNAFDNVENCK